MKKRNITEQTIVITKKTSLVQMGDRNYRFDIYQNDDRFRCWRRYYYDFLDVGDTVTLRIFRNKFGVGIDSVVGVPDEKRFDVEIREHMPTNQTERMLYEALEKQGWDITRRGWPDFACFRNGEFMVVEVKLKKDHQLRSRQLQVMKALVGQGIKAYFYYGDSNTLSEVTPDIKLP